MQQSKMHSCAPSFSSLVRLVGRSSLFFLLHRTPRPPSSRVRFKMQRGQVQRGSRGRSVRVRLLGCTGEPLCCSLLDLEKDGKLQLELSGLALSAPLFSPVRTTDCDDRLYVHVCPSVSDCSSAQGVWCCHVEGIV